MFEGPNGAGKSSIVNAIAIGLGAKTAVLGRGDHIVDFIRTGCDVARIDIEIKNDQVDENNYIITRIINKYVTFLTGCFPLFIWVYFLMY